MFRIYPRSNFVFSIKDCMKKILIVKFIKFIIIYIKISEDN